MKESCSRRKFDLSTHGSPTCLWQRAARGNITVSDIPKRQNYCVIFIVCTQFKNVAVDRGLENHILIYYKDEDSFKRISRSYEV